MPRSQQVIFLDWGTSVLHAYLCSVPSNDAENFELLEQRLGPGTSKSQFNFEQVLNECIGEWLNQYPSISLMMAGQISSNLGWFSSPYVNCPVPYTQLISAISQYQWQQHRIYVVPGIQYQGNNHVDVLRGEEVQLLGWLTYQRQHHRERLSGTQLVCLPGTHTKWVLVQQGEITQFYSAITGELYDLLLTKSVLIQQPYNPINVDDFTAGVRFYLQHQSLGLTHCLFQVRALQISAQLSTAQAPSFLSGLLIADDVHSAIQRFKQQNIRFDSLSILGNESLNQCFSTALHFFDVPCNVNDATPLTLLGFQQLWTTIKQSR
jgi:2-dehydro-3-deoxygalactonokinase